MARRRQQVSLGRVVGAGGLSGAAYGYVGTSICFLLGALALHALGATPLLVLVVGFVALATAWSYAEATAAMPEASGAASIVRRAFGPMTGFAGAWALLLDLVITVALICVVIPHYLGAVWPALQESPNSVLVGVGLLGLLVVLNVLGFQESARLISLATVLGLGTLVLLVALLLATVFNAGEALEQIDLGTAPTWRQVLYALPLAAAAYVGLDAVSSRAESTRHPMRDVPLALNVVVPLTVALGVVLSMVALHALPLGYNVVPVDPATGSTRPVAVTEGDEPGVFVLADDPTVQVVLPVRELGRRHVIPAQQPTGDVFAVAGGGQATRLYGTLLGSTYLEAPLMALADVLPEDLGWLRDILRPWLAVIVAVALFLTANSLIGGWARLIYSLARHRQVPAVLGRVDPARMTPYVGIVLLGMAAAALVVVRDLVLLVDLFGFGALLAFTLIHSSVIELRFRERTLSRPFMVPLNVRSRRALLPLPAVAGAVATFSLWAVFVGTHAAGRVLGIAWMAAGLLLYVVYRRSIGRPLLRQPAETALPASALSDVDYDRILVSVDGTRLSDEMMVLACQLASDKDATIDVVYPIEVPMHLPLDAPLDAERARGRHVLDAAMAIAEEFGVEAWAHLSTARQTGPAVAQTADEWDADVVILGAVRSDLEGDSLLSDSVGYVLRHVPGEVLLNLVPADYPMEGSAAEYDAQLAAAGGADPAQEIEGE